MRCPNVCVVLTVLISLLTCWLHDTVALRPDGGSDSSNAVNDDASGESRGLPAEVTSPSLLEESSDVTSDEASVDTSGDSSVDTSGDRNIPTSVLQEQLDEVDAALGDDGGDGGIAEDAGSPLDEAVPSATLQLSSSEEGRQDEEDNVASYGLGGSGTTDTEDALRDARAAGQEAGRAEADLRARGRRAKDKREQRENSYVESVHSDGYVETTGGGRLSRTGRGGGHPRKLLPGRSRRGMHRGRRHYYSRADKHGSAPDDQSYYHYRGRGRPQRLRYSNPEQALLDLDRHLREKELSVDRATDRVDELSAEAEALARHVPSLRDRDVVFSHPAEETDARHHRDSDGDDKGSSLAIAARALATASSALTEMVHSGRP